MWAERGGSAKSRGKKCETTGSKAQFLLKDV